LTSAVKAYSDKLFNFLVQYKESKIDKALSEGHYFLESKSSEGFSVRTAFQIVK
jgi:hypothetical protein